jgi:hypothetical protein
MQKYIKRGMHVKGKRTEGVSHGVREVIGGLGDWGISEMMAADCLKSREGKRTRGKEGEVKS